MVAGTKRNSTVYENGIYTLPSAPFCSTPSSPPPSPLLSSLYPLLPSALLLPPSSALPSTLSPALPFLPNPPWYWDNPREIEMNRNSNPHPPRHTSQTLSSVSLKLWNWNTRTTFKSWSRRYQHQNKHTQYVCTYLQQNLSITDTLGPGKQFVIQRFPLFRGYFIYIAIYLVSQTWSVMERFPLLGELM